MPEETINSDADINTHPATGLWVVRISDGKFVPIDYSFGGWNASPSWVE
jgi:hypothetical protein